MYHLVNFENNNKNIAIVRNLSKSYKLLKQSIENLITYFNYVTNFHYHRNSFPRRNYNQRDEKKSSGKEMRLVIVVGLLAVTVIALIAALTLQMAVFRKEEYKEMCQSEECIKTGIRYPILFIL